MGPTEGSTGPAQLGRAPRRPRGRSIGPTEHTQAPPARFAWALEGKRSAAAVPPAIDRVLIGGRADRAEARIRIVDGGGHSVEVHLKALPDGNTIALQILTLTATTGSRDTLSDVMKEVRLRLRRRGIVLRNDDSRESAPGFSSDLGAGQGRAR